jgi:hypothetical protein
VTRHGEVDGTPQSLPQCPGQSPGSSCTPRPRIHVPLHRRAAFDAAIAGFGAHSPMLHLALEDDQHSAPSGRPGVGLTATDAVGGRTIAVADGHLAWLESLPAISDVHLDG